MVSVLISLLAALFVRAESNVLNPTSVRVTDERVASLKIPAGFKISVLAQGLKDARMLAAGPDDDVYLTRPDQGDVVRLTLKNGKAVVETAATLPDVHGIAFDGRKVYLANISEVFVGDLVHGKINGLKRIITGLPQKKHHEKRTLLVANKRLYISIGSDCNSCVEDDDRLATILRADLDGSHLKVFAKGLRNTIGFATHPATGELWGMDHGVDTLGDDQPGEELNLIEEDVNYGWPYVTGDQIINPLMKTTPGRPGNDEQLLRMSRKPVLTYTAHSAPIGLTFVSGTMFPGDMRDDAFVAFHGSWNRKPASGYEVVRVRFEDGKPIAFEPFISGFLSADSKTQFGRPTGIAFMSDGSMVFADDSNGVVYRVTTSKSR